MFQPLQLSCEKLLDFSTCVRGITAEIFDKFIAGVLLPHLQPFNGVNPCSIIVLDNAMIHHAGEMIQDLEQAGLLVYYLPPYSPDLNPIEEAFSKVKSVLKTNVDVGTAVLAAFNFISNKDCKSVMSHCGYN